VKSQNESSQAKAKNFKFRGKWNYLFLNIRANLKIINPANHQIYVLENLTLANCLDLVGVYIQGEKYKYRSLGNICPLLGLLPDFRELILTLFNKFVDVGLYKLFTGSNTKCVF
jgi:hypothetical protein